MRSLRRPAAVFIAIALTGGLAACGDDSDDEATTASTTATTVAASGADAVDVTMRENSYTISGDLKPGGTIRLSNEGKEFHMMGMGKLKDGKTLADVVALLQEEPEEEPTTTAPAADATTTTEAAGPTTTVAEEPDPFEALFDGELGAPGTIQGPGHKAEITVPDLAAGTYALICFIPSEVTNVPHFAQGMVGQLTLAGDKAAEPTADATFKVELGKAVTGPATLTAGKHVLKFEKVGDSGETEPGLAKLDPGKTVADINRAFETFEGEDFVLPANAAATVPGQLIAGIFDFYDADSVYLGVDLTAGTYGIDAHDSDVEDPPVDSVEQATFTVT